MATTYEPIATTTLGSNTLEVEFTGISGSYTDLVLVYQCANVANDVGLLCRFNSDSGTNYSTTVLYGYTSAGSSRESNTSFVRAAGWNIGMGTSLNSPAIGIMNIQNYSNATTYKSVLTRVSYRNDGGNFETTAMTSLWRSTSAITSIWLSQNNNNLLAGSTFTLYGIASA